MYRNIFIHTTPILTLKIWNNFLIDERHKSNLMYYVAANSWSFIGISLSSLLRGKWKTTRTARNWMEKHQQLFRITNKPILIPSGRNAVCSRLNLLLFLVLLLSFVTISFNSIHHILFSTAYTTLFHMNNDLLLPFPTSGSTSYWTQFFKLIPIGFSMSQRIKNRIA